MPLSRSRDYLSIGEVLDAIRDEFPDVSISKIRFLESEGLISPERTASGYRKFYDEDLRRLRYILSLQRDHFMPLRVIRERLDRAGSNGDEMGPAAVPAAPEASAQEASKPHGLPASPPMPVADLTDVSLSRAEFLEASGLTDAQIRGLEEFGLLAVREGRVYDGADLAVGKAALGLFAYGVEPRHLRLFKQVAEREAGFLEQIVMPVAHRRDPDAPREARQSLRELLALSRQMREALLRTALDELL